MDPKITVQEILELHYEKQQYEPYSAEWSDLDDEIAALSTAYNDWVQRGGSEPANAHLLPSR